MWHIHQFIQVDLTLHILTNIHAKCCKFKSAFFNSVQNLHAKPAKPVEHCLFRVNYKK